MKSIPDRPLRILHLEDNTLDRELIKSCLETQGFQFEVAYAKTRQEFERKLTEISFDLIISDYTLPSYDGITALNFAREHCPHIPFIFVSGTIGEERAVESMKSGATDYVLKENLHRLGPVIRRALHEARERLDRRRAEDRVRESEALYQSLVETLPQNIFRKDLSGRFTFGNSRFCEFVGVPLAMLLGKTEADLFPPEVAAQCRIDDSKVVESSLSLESVHEIERSSGQKIVLQSFKSPLRAADGKVTGIQGIFWDITEKKNLEAQSLRSQRMESLGTLAGGIAHDLNNVLAPIMMSIEVLRLKISDPDAARILNTIESSARRGADMVKQVLTFARGVQGDRVTLQLAHIIKEVTKILKQTFPRNIVIRSVLPPNLWPVVGDPTQIHQVLMNLCVNARDAMPEGGNLVLSASNFTCDEAFATMQMQANPGPHVKITVKDSGAGIPPELLERIFEPFFTTKPLDKGTGLGLSTVRGIVRSHGGFVQVESELGKGSTFGISLPAIPSTANAQSRPQTCDLATGHGELILVVDDEAAVTHITQQTLETFGYRVLTASDGAEAIGVCAQHKTELSLVITDMMMPILDGEATVKGIRRIAPKIKIIAATGLTSHTEATGPDKLDIEAVLSKPYTAEVLLRTVHRVLNDPDRIN